MERHLHDASRTQQMLDRSYEVVEQITALRLSMSRLHNAHDLEFEKSPADPSGSYRAAREQLDTQVNRLRALVSDDPGPLSRLADIVDEMRLSRATTDQALELLREGKRELALARRAEAADRARPLAARLDFSSRRRGGSSWIASRANGLPTRA